MVGRVSRRRYLVAAGMVALSGCTTGTDGNSTVGGPESETGTRDGTTAGESPPLADYTLPLPKSGAKLRQEAQSGGPPKDGIPSIDDPAFVDAKTADDRLDSGDIVFGVTRGNVAKAYPQSVVVWHEIVNDVVDGDPVSVTYCPLTGTVQGFPRGETTFGVSGRLLNNNLIMYDRATENWWPQVLATAIPGPWNSSLAGSSLAEFRVIWTTWGRWKQRYPTTTVLSTDTGYARNYGRDPYGSYNPRGGYYSSDSTLFPRLNPNDRFHPKHVVMGVRSADGAAAVSKNVVRKKGVVNGEIGGIPLLYAYDNELDTAFAYWNPDSLEFTYQDGDVAGPEKTYRPAALPLERALTFDGMWFAWSGFYPELSVHE